MLKRRQAMIALLVGLVTMVAITATVYGHVTGLFHYHAGVGYITQLWADPTNPVDGRYGVFTWIYINPTYNDPSTSSDQSGWLGVNIRNGGTYARVQAGHGRLSDNSQDVFVELFYSNPYILSCRGGSTFVLYGPDSATCRASQSMFNVPYDWWYTLAMGDYAEDGRWKVGIKIQSILIAVIDFDNASGFAGQHHMGEITANGTYSLEYIYNNGGRWGASFAGFQVATGTNGVDGPFEQIGGSAWPRSNIRDSMNSQWGRVGCDPGAPGGNGHANQAVGWLSGWPTSNAHGTNPPVVGSCY